jgi:hypothetical protein
LHIDSASRAEDEAVRQHCSWIAASAEAVKRFHSRACVRERARRLNRRNGCVWEEWTEIHSSAKAISVLKIGWVLAILFAASWFASEVRLPSEVRPSSASEQMVWRRTADGWEKMDGWSYGIERTPPALHPGVFGLLMIAATLCVGVVRQEDRHSCLSGGLAQHDGHDRQESLST